MPLVSGYVQTGFQDIPMKLFEVVIEGVAVAKRIERSSVPNKQAFAVRGGATVLQIVNNCPANVFEQRQFDHLAGFGHFQIYRFPVPVYRRLLKVFLSTDVTNPETQPDGDQKDRIVALAFGVVAIYCAE